MLEQLPADLQPRARLLGLTSVQATLVEDAFRRDPAALARALGHAEGARMPAAYLVSSARSICADALAKAALPVARPGRHDLEPVACRDCGDTGFVVLVRDVGVEARAGDAAPCHCATGISKQARYGTVHYAHGDYEPAVPDPTVPLISFQEYAQSEAGKNDPNLAAYTRFINPKEML